MRESVYIWVMAEQVDGTTLQQSVLGQTMRLNEAKEELHLGQIAESGLF